jgi:hypothetical protein
MSSFLGVGADTVAIGCFPFPDAGADPVAVDFPPLLGVGAADGFSLFLDVGLPAAALGFS